MRNNLSIAGKTTALILGMCAIAFCDFLKRDLHIAFLYSQGITSHYGSENNVLMKIIEKQAEMNDALNRSGVYNLSVKIVHAQEIPWDEANPLNSCASAEALTWNGGPEILHKYSPDFIFLLTLNRPSGALMCGCVSNAPCVDGQCDMDGTRYAHGDKDCFESSTPVVSHELGHLLGLNHDWDAIRKYPEQGTSAFTPYAYGYLYKPGGVAKWGDIMSYPPAYINYYSTPLINHPIDNVPIGTPYNATDPADASLALTEIAPIVTEFKLSRPDLHSHQPKTNLQRDAGGMIYYKVKVPPFSTNGVVTLSGGTGDADLFVGDTHFPLPGYPETYLCGSRSGSNTESCSFNPSQYDTDSLYVLVHAYNTFSGVTVETRFTPPTTVSFDSPANNVSDAANASRYFRFVVPEGASNIRISLGGGTGNADLFVWKNRPEIDHPLCGSTNSDNTEVCNQASGLSGAGTYYIEIFGRTSYSGANLTVDYDWIGGGLTRDIWQNVPGTAISALTSIPFYQDVYSSSSVIPKFESQTNFQDNYASRLHGYLLPPSDGWYSFWIAGDDDCELWLSADDKAATRERIAYVSGWTSPQQWTKYPSQKSTARYLLGGTRYFIEALHKEGGGGDNLAVAWETPFFPRKVIDGKYIAPDPDLVGPAAPVFINPPSRAENPVLQWQSGGRGGIATYKYVFENNPEVITSQASFAFPSGMPHGRYTLKVREADKAGNWSSETEQSTHVIQVLNNGQTVTDFGGGTTNHSFKVNLPDNYLPGSLVVNFSYSTPDGAVQMNVNRSVFPTEETGTLDCDQGGDSPVRCASSNGSSDWNSPGTWYIDINIMTFISDGDGSLTATYQTIDPSPPPPGAPVPGVYYQVKAEHSGKCLSVSGASQNNGAKLEQWDCLGAAQQKIKLVAESGGRYSLRFQHSSKVADVSGASQTNGASVHQWQYAGGSNQIVNLINHGNGTYSFAYNHSGKCLDISGNSTANGGLVVQWTCSGNANQRFRFIP